MEIPRVTLNELERYLTLTGKRGSLAISTLGRLDSYIENVLNSEVGREILKDDVERIEDLLMKTYRGDVTELEKAELRYLRDVRIPKILTKLRNYLEKINEVKKVVGK